METKVRSGRMTFGKYISRRRADLHLTQQKLAELLDISPAYLCDMESDRRTPASRERIRLLADKLETNYAYMLYLAGLFHHDDPFLSEEVFTKAWKLFCRTAKDEK